MIDITTSFVIKSDYIPWPHKANLAEMLLKDALDREQILLGQIAALKRKQDFSHEMLDGGAEAARALATLTKRQKEILKLILAGKSNKIVAFDTGINQEPSKIIGPRSCARPASVQLQR